MTTLKSQLHDLALQFSKETGLRPVSMVEAAMERAAALALEQATAGLKAGVDDLVKRREKANRDNRSVV